MKLKQERSTDFKASVGQAQVTLQADWQKYLKPARRIGLEILIARDDKGKDLEISKGLTGDDENNGVIVAGNGRFVVRRGGMVVAAGGIGGGLEEDQTAQSFTLKGLSAGATKISLQGAARFSFPLDKADVVIDNPAAAEPQQAGDVTVAVKNQGAGRFWKVTFTQTPGRPPVVAEDVDGRIDKDSFVAVDDAGKEHQATLSDARGGELQLVMRGGQAADGTPLASYLATFATLQNRMPKQIRFKFVSQVFVKTVPLVLKDIALP